MLTKAFYHSKMTVDLFGMTVLEAPDTLLVPSRSGAISCSPVKSGALFLQSVENQIQLPQL